MFTVSDLEDGKPLARAAYEQTDKYGNKFIFDAEGHLHCEDGPAIEWKDGSVDWYKYGKLHRLDGPAMIKKDGWQWWFVNGKRHRLDGPAAIGPGIEKWYYNNINVPPPLQNETTKESYLRIARVLLNDDVDQLHKYGIKIKSMALEYTVDIDGDAYVFTYSKEHVDLLNDIHMYMAQFLAGPEELANA